MVCPSKVLNFRTKSRSARLDIQLINLRCSNHLVMKRRSSERLNWPHNEMSGYPAQSLLPSTPSEPAVLVILFTKHSEYEFAPCTSCTSPTAADTGRADTSRADANRRSLKRGAQHRVTVSSSVSRRSVRPGHFAA